MAKSKKKAIKPVPVETRTRRVEAEPTNNTALIKKIIAIVLLLIGLYLVLNYVSGWQDDKGDKAADDDSAQVEKSDDDDKKDDKDTKVEVEPNGTSVKESDKEFGYVVGEGESYTTMARRAVASVDGKLTLAERVAAETKLTTDASAQWLNEGQDLVLEKDTVRTAVDWAKSLSEGEKAAWQPYADLIAW